MRLFILKKIQVVFILLLVTFTATKATAYQINKYVSYQLHEQNIIIKTLKGTVNLSAYSDNAIEAHYQFENKLNTADFLPSFAIKENASKQKFSILETPLQLRLSAGKLTALINKAPFSISYYQGKKLLVSEELGFFTGTTVEQDSQYNIQGFRFNLSEDEKLLGGGERVLGMDRRSHRMPLYNRAHYGYETNQIK